MGHYVSVPEAEGKLEDEGQLCSTPKGECLLLHFVMVKKNMYHYLQQHVESQVRRTHGQVSELVGSLAGLDPAALGGGWRIGPGLEAPWN